MSAPTAPMLQEFEALEDPRQSARCLYPLQEMLLVALCAVCSDADDWVHVAEWGRYKLAWLRKWLPFEQGVASHDTFSRLFGLLDPKVFEACFVRWMQRLSPALAGQSIAIDGKSLRGSHEGGEPPRVCRRQFGLSYAATAGWSSMGRHRTMTSPSRSCTTSPTSPGATTTRRTACASMRSGCARRA